MNKSCLMKWSLFHLDVQAKVHTIIVLGRFSGSGRIAGDVLLRFYSCWYMPSRTVFITNSNRRIEIVVRIILNSAAIELILTFCLWDV